MEGNPRVSYIGYVDEIYYVSTAPIENDELTALQRHQSEIHTQGKVLAKHPEETTLLHDKNQACIIQMVNPIIQKSPDTSATKDVLKKRNKFMRQYMKEKRAKRQFREEENKKKLLKNHRNVKGKVLKPIKCQIQRRSNRWRNKQTQKDERVILRDLKNVKDNIW